ncbi:Carnitine transport ATP-binding protein OpuCA [Listeria monocytogenes]|nr:Carnitine transport ATP-binding protein OpuCA [Listeria monocytogenes]
MDEAIKLADRIVIMKAGEIVQFDTPDEILKPDVTQVAQIMNKPRLLS